MKIKRASLALFLSLCCPAVVFADDPLKLISSDAEAVVKIEQPRKLLETGLDPQLISDLLKIEAIRDALDSTQYRRFHQLRIYIEKKLGHGYADLVDKLAGGGIVVSGGFSDRPTILAVMEARDEKLLHDAVQLALQILDEELARQEVRERPVRKKHGDVETIHLGKQLHGAVIGKTLLLSNDPGSLHAAMDRVQGKKQGPQIAALVEARKILPEKPMAWGWLNLEAIRKVPGVKTAIETAEANPQNTLILGGLLDLTKAAPFVCVGISGEARAIDFTVRVPRGRHTVSESAKLLLPSDEKGSLPLLEPKNVMLSLSYYLDLGKLWDNRAKLLNKEQLKGLEAAEASSGLFLGGTKMSTLLQQAGAYQRIVVAQQPTACYKTEPRTKIPAFAVIVQMRDPAFARSMETVLRAGGLLASTQLQLKMHEEKHAGTNIISYRFDETKKLGGDTTGIRFNFSPAFAKAGDQFIMCSTEELCRNLIDMVTGEKDPQYSSSTSRIQAYGPGVAALLQAGEEQVLSQAILGQGISLEAAKEQLRAILAIAERLGSLRLEEHYGTNDFRYDLRWLRK